MEVLFENAFFLVVVLLCLGMHFFGHGHRHGHRHGRHSDEPAGPAEQPAPGEPIEPHQHT